MNKKAQMDVKELGVTLVLAAILFTVGVLIFANISNSTDRILDPTRVAVENESVTITTATVLSDNSTLLATLGFITATDVVRNITTPFTQLTRDTDYTITLNGGSGALTTTANFTLLDFGYNATQLAVSYDRNTESAAQASTNTIENTVLDSFELGVIALIVLAAVVILTVLFALGSR